MWAGGLSYGRKSTQLILQCLWKTQSLVSKCRLSTRISLTARDRCLTFLRWGSLGYHAKTKQIGSPEESNSIWDCPRTLLRRTSTFGEYLESLLLPPLQHLSPIPRRRKLKFRPLLPRALPLSSLPPYHPDSLPSPPHPLQHGDKS